jgi:SAM-dependent methyltransferase
LPVGLQEFSDFFSDLDRLHTVARILKGHLTGRDRLVLNVGSGPFATEIFVGALQQHRICSFDYTAEFGAFYDIFRREGLLGNTVFLRASAASVEFVHGHFDLIIMNDILYEQALDADGLLRRYHAFLAPSGLIYFDFMNRQTRWLWRLLGKERGYRRYTPDEIRVALEQNGFDVLVWTPPDRSNKRPKRIVQDLLWYGLRTSNTVAVLARKRESGDA